MKESVLDVLRYLFEHYADGAQAAGPEQDSLKSELTRAGFSEVAVDKALSWLETLAAADAGPRMPAGGAGPPFRVFAAVEQDRLDVRLRGYLLALEQGGMLDALQREVVIDRVMALDVDEVDLDQLRWVVRMVLYSHPSRDPSGIWREPVVFDQVTDHLH